MKQTYHHGDLEQELLAHAIDSARKFGSENISLRNLAGQIGVSPSAAYHHFSDKETLLRAAADQALEMLADRFEKAISDIGNEDVQSAWLRFNNLGRAYIDFAIHEPHLFRLAFGPHCRSLENDQTPRAWKLLTETIEDLVLLKVIPTKFRDRAQLLAWSSVHGVATLILDGHLDQESGYSVLDQIKETWVR